MARFQGLPAPPAQRLRTLREHGEVDAKANLLIYGDNARALPALSSGHHGLVQCAYLDPPYNTGRKFAEYTDVWSKESWANMMQASIASLKPLLSRSATVVVQIDDNELGALLRIMDDALGAKNRISTITLVRSAATGHKAKNAGPINVTDFLLMYAVDRACWSGHAMKRTRAKVDPAYQVWIENPDEPPSAWRFGTLRGNVANALGFASPRAARAALGPEAFDRHVESRALESAVHVARFAEPRYEAIGQAARNLVDCSKARKEQVFVLERACVPPLILRGGKRILRLSDKVDHIDGSPRMVEPLTNIWDDVPFQGISREGGVVFSRNKKPERLLERILRMTTQEGDWVLDPFVGSGTTAAVAHKLGRRWIGIDAGSHVLSIAEPRLSRVVLGQDMTGISKSVGFSGGGGFRVCAA